MAQWGHDFGPTTSPLSGGSPSGGPTYRVSPSPTATEATHREIASHGSRSRVRSSSSPSFDRPNIQYRIVPKLERAPKQLLEFVRSEGVTASTRAAAAGAPVSGIVYAAVRASTEKIAGFLAANGVNALPYHAGLDAGLTTGARRALPARRRRGRGRDDRIRHGHRQARRAIRRPRRPAEVGRGLLPRDGSRRRDSTPATAWLAYGLRRRAAASHDRRESRRSRAPAAARAAPRCDARSLETVQCRRNLLPEVEDDQRPQKRPRPGLVDAQRTREADSVHEPEQEHHGQSYPAGAVEAEELGGERTMFGDTTASAR